MPEPTLRFAVGDPNGRSSNSWRIWVKPDGDVYIACRDNYAELKVSLHGDRWRVGFTEEGAAATSQLRPPDEDRAWMVWDRPDPVEGITAGFRLLFLPSELGAAPTMRSKSWEDVEYFPAAPQGGVTVVDVTINEPNVALGIGDSTGELIEYHRRFLPAPRGGQVQLTSHHRPLDEDHLRSLAHAYREAQRMVEARSIDVPATGRLFLTGRSADTVHFATEVNYARPNPDPLRLSV